MVKTTGNKQATTSCRSSHSSTDAKQREYLSWQTWLNRSQPVVKMLMMLMMMMMMLMRFMQMLMLMMLMLMMMMVVVVVHSRGFGPFTFPTLP